MEFISSKKISLFFLLIFLFPSLPSFCEEGQKPNYFPFLLSIYKNISIPSPSDTFNTSLSFGALNAQYQNLYGLGFSLFYQESLTSAYGVQVAPVNIVDESLYGAQIGIYNESKKTQDGIQIGITNFTNDFNGVQIGVFNSAKNGHGLQLGLINYSEYEEGATFGPISIVKQGIFRLSTTYSLQNQLALQSEFGGKLVYTMVRYKYDFFSEVFKYYLGIGSQIDLYKEKLRFYPQIFMSGFGSPLRQYGLTTKVGFLFNESLELVSGIHSILNLDVENSSGGFAHENKYNFDAFLGLQINFIKPPLSFLLK